MKKILLVHLFICFISKIIAQPSISNYNWVSGIHRYFYTEATINPNPVPPGNNVTWDFTSLTSDPDDSATFQISGGTPFTSDFPNANVVWSEYKKSTNQTVLWHFYKDQFSFEFLGYGEVGVGTNVFSSQKKMLKFPFTFNSTFVDYYTAGSSYTSTVKYDGYGTLKLPNATYTNVYRTTSKDSVSPSNITYYYEWFDANRRIMFMEVSSGFTSTYYLKTQNSTSVSSVYDEASIQIYPNPSVGNFSIKLPGGMNITEIQLYNMMGQCIENRKYDSADDLIFTVSELGYYWVIIKSEENIYYKKVFNSF